MRSRPSALFVLEPSAPSQPVRNAGLWRVLGHGGRHRPHAAKRPPPSSRHASGMSPVSDIARTRQRPPPSEPAPAPSYTSGHPDSEATAGRFTCARVLSYGRDRCARDLFGPRPRPHRSRRGCSARQRPRLRRDLARRHTFPETVHPAQCTTPMRRFPEIAPCSRALSERRR